jgi:hypothetical protein
VTRAVPDLNFYLFLPVTAPAQPARLSLACPGRKCQSGSPYRDVGRVRQWLFARSVQGSIGSPLMRQVARQLAPA